ncbi:hypothetical protein PYCC9005_003518 [Savitreella phatthalungensis]
MFFKLISDPGCRLTVSTGPDKNYAAIAEGAHFMVMCTPGEGMRHGYKVTFALAYDRCNSWERCTCVPGDPLNKARQIETVSVGYRTFSVSGKWTDAVGGGHPSKPMEEFWLRDTKPRKVTKQKSGLTNVVFIDPKLPWPDVTTKVESPCLFDSYDKHYPLHPGEQQTRAKVHVSIVDGDAVVSVDGDSEDVGVIFWTHQPAPPTQGRTLFTATVTCNPGPPSYGKDPYDHASACDQPFSYSRADYFFYRGPEARLASIGWWTKPKPWESIALRFIPGKMRDLKWYVRGFGRRRVWPIFDRAKAPSDCKTYRTIASHWATYDDARDACSEASTLLERHHYVQSMRRGFRNVI